jgi:DNA-binding response OmpR family regulator
VEKILIISDDPASQTDVCSLLVKAGYDVEIAAPNNRAIRAIKTSALGLVILDDLPSSVLHDRCRQIRRQSLDIPLLVLSVVSEVEQIVELLRLGADDYITKPFHPSEFLARIRAALRHGVVC